MKIKDLVNRVQKTKEHQDVVYVSDIAEKLGIHDMYDCYDEQDRLTSYYIISWNCTDSRVGSKVYFFDEKPVAVSFQEGRKLSEDINWFSIEDFKEVKKYILSFKKEDDDNISLIDINEDLPVTYKINFNSQIYAYHKLNALYSGQKVKIVKMDTKGWTPSNITIEFEDGSTLDTDIKELDFPYNLNKEIDVKSLIPGNEIEFYLDDQVVRGVIEEREKMSNGEIDFKINISDGRILRKKMSHLKLYNSSF